MVYNHQRRETLGSQPLEQQDALPAVRTTAFQLQGFYALPSWSLSSEGAFATEILARFFFTFLRGLIP